MVFVPDAYSSNIAWNVDFYYGYVNGYKGYGYHVRSSAEEMAINGCVRALIAWTFSKSLFWTDFICIEQPDKHFRVGQKQNTWLPDYVGKVLPPYTMS